MKEITLASGETALVDDEDHERLATFRWQAVRQDNGLIYASRQVQVAGKVTTIYLHRAILGANAGEHVDHRDGNGLNNTRYNLRLCSNSQNSMNRRKQLGTSSKYKGVSWIKAEGKWRAAIRVNRRSCHIGLFADEEQAARAYDAKARVLFGEFARLNFG